MRRKIASRLGKLFYVPENAQTFQIHIVKGKIICEGNHTKMKEIIQQNCVDAKKMSADISFLNLY